MQSLYISLRDIKFRRVGNHTRCVEDRKMQESQNITYILQCSDNTLYTGWTNNLKKRLKAHNTGQGAKYTRGRTPVKLVYAEVHESKHEAMSREVQIKRLTRKEKEALILSQQETLKMLPEDIRARLVPYVITTAAYLQQNSTS